MMKEFCPFCDKSSDEILFSDEHIIPESIGGTLTIRICKVCNDTLGRNVDSLLINSRHIKLANYAAAIKGKRKTAVNPFEKASIANDPSTKIRIELDSEKKPYIRYIPKPFKIIKKDDKEYLDIIVDERDYNNLLGMVNKFLKRRGRKPLNNEELYNSVTQTISESPVVHCRFESELFSYYPCLLKIAYEIAWKCFGNDYLNDHYGLRIRKSINQIREGRSKPTKNWAKDIEDLISFMPDDGIANIYPRHFNLVLLKHIDSEHQVSVYISILGIITAFVIVSETPDKYENIDFMYVNDSSECNSWIGKSAEVIYNSLNTKNL